MNLWRSGSRSPIRLFILASVTVLGLVGLGAYATAHQLAHDEAIDDAIISAERMTSGIAEPFMYADADHPAYDANLAIIDDLVRSRQREGMLLRAKIWDEDGTILYSDEKRLIGQRFELSEDEQALLGHGGSAAELSDLDSPENRFDQALTEASDGVVEVYACFMSVEGVPLLFEAYMPVNDIFAQRAEMAKKLVPMMLTGPILLFVLMLPLGLTMLHAVRDAEKNRLRYLTRATEAADRERRTISRQLHDEVIPELAAAGYELESVTHESASYTTEERRQAVLGAHRRVVLQIDLIRLLLGNLRSPSVARLGFAGAVDELVEPLRDRETEVHLDLHQAEELGRTGEQIAFHVVRECVRNVERHARASTVAVVARRTDQGLEITVTDDGDGFDVESSVAGTHHGLRLLQEGLADVGGRVHVSSAVGQGTTVWTCIPDGALHASAGVFTDTASAEPPVAPHIPSPRSSLEDLVRG